VTHDLCPIFISIYTVYSCISKIILDINLPTIYVYCIYDTQVYYSATLLFLEYILNLNNLNFFDLFLNYYSQTLN